jgi:hypothetical protein
MLVVTPTANRLGGSEEIAHAVAFLCKERAKWITRQVSSSLSGKGEMERGEADGIVGVEGQWWDFDELKRGDLERFQSYVTNESPCGRLAETIQGNSSIETIWCSDRKQEDPETSLQQESPFS